MIHILHHSSDTVDNLSSSFHSVHLRLSSR